MRDKSATSDLATAKIAARQHGVVSTRQLLETGLTRSGISRRVQSGRLHRVHQGVYAVGHPGLSPHESWMAAILACGRGATSDHRTTVLRHWGATLSHRSAAILWQLLPASDGPVDVSVPGRPGRQTRRGIRLHRCPGLLPASVTSRHGIPVTTPARTITDLRRASKRDEIGAISSQELRRAIRQAEVLGLPTGTEAATERTRSDLELAFLRLCRCHRLPTPEVNVWIGPLQVDFLWRDRHLIVETDGYRYHRGRAAFEDDRSRDLKLRALGYEVIRLTYRQVVDDPEQIANALRVMLS